MSIVFTLSLGLRFCRILLCIIIIIIIIIIIVVVVVVIVVIIITLPILLIPLSITPAKKCLCQKSRNINAPLPLCYHLSYLLLASLTDFLFAGHVILGDNCVTRAKRTFA